MRQPNSDPSTIHSELCTVGLKLAAHAAQGANIAAIPVIAAPVIAAKWNLTPSVAMALVQPFTARFTIQRGIRAFVISMTA
ncbi:hypothetical protein [Halioxenophilus aromaticivorans]|uniref:Uncharacterized protein n=1 Tax=Halioxenophilus aromaticivorans TaxID=1306992 RepID=A0AAV3TZ45_9ALTE